MTTLVSDAPATSQPARTVTGAYRVTLGHQIRSEAIKLVSLRSPWWSAALVAAISIGMAALYSFSMVMSDFTGSMTGNDLVAGATLMPTIFTVLLASIIGTMLVTGEYSTGMIRSTLTAAPDRLRSLVAKVAVTGAFVFLVSLVTMLVSAGIAVAFFSGADKHMDFSSPVETLLPYLCGMLYLAAIGIMGVGIGYIVRNGAGAIAIIVAITLILPMIPGFVAMIPGMEWINEVARFLPTNAGQEFMMSPDDRLHGGLVLLGWVVATTGLGAIVLKSKDA